jgi:hypothetical protein
VLPVDRGNAKVIFHTEDYAHKIATILEDRQAKGPTEAVERKTFALIRTSLLSDKVA